LARSRESIGGGEGDQSCADSVCRLREQQRDQVSNLSGYHEAQRQINTKVKRLSALRRSGKNV